MKKIISAVIILSLLATMLTFANGAASAAETPKRGTLIWSDEFEGTSLNTNNWVYDVGYGEWGNNELEYYRSGTNNINVSGGVLTITAKKESYGGASYTSGRITTCGKQSFLYGTLEARLKMSNGQGIWPAFWMLSNSASWPDGGELDIMEHINSESTVYGTAHDWNGGDTRSNGGAKYNIDVTQYHTYTIEWTSTEIKWFVDDVLYHTVNTVFPNNGSFSNDVFHEPYYFLLNVAVGGDWPGDPVSSSFPASMSVDYVRVYQNIDTTGINIKKNGSVVANGSSTSVTSEDEAITFTAAVTPSNATNQNYTFTVSNSSVAAVNGNTVTVTPANATADTSVVITATSEDGSYKATHTVNIEYIESQSGTPEAFIFKVGANKAYWTTYNYAFDVAVPCTFVDGVTYVPFRTICDAAGATDVTYNSDAGKVIMTNKYNMTFTLTLNSVACSYVYNGETVYTSLNSAPIFIGGQCCLPIRDIANITFANVQYEESGSDGYVIVSNSALNTEQAAVCINEYSANI